MAGYVKLYRKIQDHWVWDDKPFSRGQAWMDLVMRVNHIPSKIVIDGCPVEVERGQHYTSEIKLSERWGWSRKKVHAFLGRLATDKMLHTKRHNKGTVVTLTNYDVWQGSGTAEEPQKSSRRTAEAHKQEYKNIRTISPNGDIGGDKPHRPTLDEVKAYCLERQNKVDPQKWLDHYTSNGWKVGKVSMKDWMSAVRTWEKNELASRTRATATPKRDSFEQREYTDDHFERIANLSLRKPPGGMNGQSEN